MIDYILRKLHIHSRTRQFAAALALTVLAGGLYLSVVHESPEHIAAQCQNAGNKPLCYTNLINEVVRTRGLSAAFEVLVAAYNADPAFAATCHANTHDLGKAAYIEFHRTGKVVLSPETSFCGYGFYHGFMEEMLAETHDFSEARAFCRYAAEQVPTPPGYAEGACYHGIGHGITDGYDPRLWGDAEAMSAPGIALCREVASSNDEWDRRCASGVFNSVAILYRNPKYKLVAQNPFELCATPYAGVEKEACYDQMNTLAAFMARGDFSKAIGYTNKITNDTYRAIAIKGIGGYYIQDLRLAGKTILPKEVSGVCVALDSQFRAVCIGGLVEGIMEFGAPGLQYVEILALCRTPNLSANLRPACFGALARLSEVFYPKPQLQAVCKEIPKEYDEISACSDHTAAPSL